MTLASKAQNFEMILCLGWIVLPACSALYDQSGSAFKVEHCAGDGQVSRAFTALGYQGKKLDVTWLLCSSDV